MPKEEWKRKRPKQQVQQPKDGHGHLPGPSKENLKMSAWPIEKSRHKNLTLFDWMTVYAYVDTLPQPVNQRQVVRHFASRHEGALVFSQPTLSRKLKERPEMEARVHSIPNALSSKRPRVVTRPDVDEALWLWVQEMEKKGEIVNGRMLMAKREAFEERMDVPGDERLPGTGWIQPFCQA